MSRRQALDDFVRTAGFAPEDLTPLAGDASNRRYLRLTGRVPAVVMDAPPEKGEDIAPFVAVTHWLRQAAFNAPEILAEDPLNGFLILEDLGDNLFARHCREVPGDETALYGAAVDLLADLGRIDAPVTLPGGRELGDYDAGILLTEARLVIDWYLRGLGESSPDLAAEFAETLTAATAHVASAALPRKVMVLRDYHAENLIWMPSRSGHLRVGLLDYQDALAGHPAYDLVSLLEDARRDTSEELRQAMLARMIGHLARGADGQTGTDEIGFRQAYAALGAQRNLKIVGIFARLCLRDGKSRYPEMIPRVWRHLMHDLRDPSLGELSLFVTRHLPEPEPAIIAKLQAQAGTPA